MAKPARNARESRVERMVRTLQGLGLTIHGVELLEGRAFRILTAPLSGLPPAANVNEDPVDRWLRENG
jgi:hypothetical protein